MSSPDSFFQAQNAQKSVFDRPRWGSLRRSPSPFPSPRLRRLGSQAPLNTKSWLRQWKDVILDITYFLGACECLSEMDAWQYVM